ncbi:MAG: decarboxylating 6-phosphogluconate dehydrogenase [Dehalococcoidia bacterium]|nr:decarboxylating 6-phosphogluconate dehydrogenase [Dehalococcoidia bacterium]
MQIAMIGLGRMGANMTLRLLAGGHEVVVYDRNPEAAAALKDSGAAPALSLEELVKRLKPPRHVWIMVPAGLPVTQTIAALVPLMAPGDAIIDGGNSNYHDSVARAQALAEKGLHFMDVGTSGGVWGLKNGYCLMIGGDEAVFRRLEPVFKTLAPAGGYGYMGPAGAGHYVKMVHNGIEYGLLQAYAEGFELLDASTYDLDLRRIAALWSQGSVVRSWLLELAEIALEKDPKLASIAGFVEDSGEGRWTVQEAIDRGVPATVLAYSLFARFRSRQQESFGAKLIAALREQFGGHGVKRE